MRTFSLLHKSEANETKQQYTGLSQPRTLLALSGLLFMGIVQGTSPTFAEGVTGDIGTSVTVTGHANKAAEYWEKADYIRARDEFRQVISYVPTSVESYEGLMNCCEKTKEWPQVAFACEKIFDLSTERKKFYEYDYGVALYNMNRFDLAMPHLKAALATADIPPPPFKPIQLKLDQGSGNVIKAPEIIKKHDVGLPPVQAFGSTPVDIAEIASTHVITSGSSVDTTKLQNFDNAIRSEFICIAEYKGYDKTDDIRFNSPPATHWHVDKILKGPPLGSSLPLRYDFHTPELKEPPAGWKFDDSKLPKIGSKWIIFIEFGVAERGLYNTYLGSYGRQPATEENLNTLDRLLTEHNMRNQGL